jgi:hypothetical protein
LDLVLHVSLRLLLLLLALTDQPPTSLLTKLHSAAQHNHLDSRKSAQLERHSVVLAVGQPLAAAALLQSVGQQAQPLT